MAVRDLTFVTGSILRTITFQVAVVGQNVENGEDAAAEAACYYQKHQLGLIVSQYHVAGTLLPQFHVHCL